MPKINLLKMRIINSIGLAVLPFIMFAQTIEELGKQRVEFDEIPGIAVGYFENGQSHYFSSGFADISSKELVTSKTIFEIGSITKTFTCSVLSYMVQQRELSLNDKAQQYLPPSIILPERNGKAITLFHLATAHSGLPRMPGNFSPEDPENPYIDYTEKELTAYLNNCELNSEPGSKYEYSNLGMGLLGFILTQKRNEPYAQLIKQTILKPLAMNQTFISGETKSKLLATGYVDKNPKKAWTWSNQSVIIGAGGIVSNAEDMLKFLLAQMSDNKTVLSNAFAEARKERADAGSDSMKIGLGWHIRDHKYIWHNGGTGGFRSFAGFDPVKKRAVIILTNSTNGADDLGFHWLDETYPLKKMTKPLELDPSQIKQYEGVYEVSPTFKITISVQGALLFLQATNQPKLSLFAEDADKFFLKVVEAKIQFGRNAEGKIEKLTLFQKGTEIVGKKIQ
jgi:serine-type D-Ala-D-Ala carboxypeptidase/endopeptidase